MVKKIIHINSSELDSLFNYGKLEYFYNSFLEKSESLSLLTQGDIQFESLEFDERNDSVFKVNIRNNGSQITISNCIFKKKLMISGNNVNTLTINNVVFEEGVDFDFDCKSFKIENCPTPCFLKINVRVFNEFSIVDCNFSKTIIKGNFQSEVYVNRIKSEVFSLEDATIFKKVHLSHIECDILDILNSTFKSSISITDCPLIKEVNFNNAVFNRKILVSNSIIKDFAFSESKFNDLTVQKSQIMSQMSFSFKESERNILEIMDDSQIEVLQLSGLLSQNSSLEIGESSIKNLVFSYFKNYGALKLSDVRIKEDGNLIFNHSNLGRAEIYNCDFSKSTFKFEKSQIIEIFISGTDFPEKILGVDRFQFYGQIFNDNAVPKKDYEQSKLAFGQLHTVFQKQGDSVRSYEYQAREVKSYYQFLKLSRKTFFPKFNLFLNYVSNNFGRSWGQGLLFSFGIGLFFYSILLISTNKFSFGVPKHIDWEYSSSFFKFMNPIRHFDTDEIFRNSKGKIEIVLSNWSYLWDFFGRIFIAYSYYQTIQAFRKFGRK